MSGSFYWEFMSGTLHIPVGVKLGREDCKWVRTGVWVGWTGQGYGELGDG